MADDALTAALRNDLLLALARADGQPWADLIEATPHTANVMYGAQADAVLAVVREHTAAQVAAVERERDEWRARRDRAIETCRFRHQDGLTAEEWHTRTCGAMQGAQRERARAERAEAQVAAAKAEALREAAEVVRRLDGCGFFNYAASALRDRAERLRGNGAVMTADAAALERVRALVSDWQANGGSRPLGDPTADTWHECARQLLRALDADTTEEQR